jgi:hypothetical protein
VNITKDIVELYDKTVGTTGATTKPTATPAAPKPTATPVKKQP